MENLKNDFATTLAAAITGTGDTSITVASSTGAPSPNFRIRVDDELMLVTAVSHPTWTVTRSIEGTTAATHSNGADVAHVMTKEGLDGYARESLNMLRTTIDAGGTLTIPAGHQMLVVGDYVADGDLFVDGDLFFLE